MKECQCPSTGRRRGDSPSKGTEKEPFPGTCCFQGCGKTATQGTTHGLWPYVPHDGWPAPRGGLQAPKEGPAQIHGHRSLALSTQAQAGLTRGNKELGHLLKAHLAPGFDFLFWSRVPAKGSPGHEQPDAAFDLRAAHERGCFYRRSGRTISLRYPRSKC